MDNSSKAIIDAVILLNSNEELRKSLGQNASKIISNDHTWENYGKNVAKLYKDLLQ